MARTPEESSHSQETKSCSEEVWLLDSGCSNHMCGSRHWVYDLDVSFKTFVKLGDDSKIIIEGIRNVKLEIDGIMQVITGVFYIPNLKNNLLSIGPLQEKGLSVVFENNACDIYHSKKGLIIPSTMQRNKMFKTKALVMPPNCFKMTGEDLTQLWNSRYSSSYLKEW